MALGDIYTEQQVDEEIDKLLPVYNQGRPPEQQLSRDTIRTLVRAENMGGGGVTFANRRSPVGATGVMQVMPETIKGLKGTKHLAPDFPEDLTNAPLSHQVLAGIAATREMADRAKTTDWKTLAMHYNAGPVVGSGKAPMPEETKGYLLKGYKAREMMGIADTPLPPTAATVKPSAAFATSPLQSSEAAYGTMMALVPALEQALFGGNAAASNARNVQQVATLAAGEAAATTARTQAELTIEQNNFHLELLKSVGLDKSDPTSALNQELQREAATRRKRETLENDIVKMESLDFFSNPLEFLMAQPKLKAATAQYNQLANIENRSAAEISRMQTLATNLKNLTPSQSADLLRTKAEADAQLALKNAEFQAAQISERNAAGSAKMALDMFTLKKDLFQAALGMEGKEFTQKFQAAQFDALLEDRADRSAARKLTAEQKAREEEQAGALVTGINLYSRAITGNNVNLTKEDIKRMPANVRGAWYEVIMRGNYGNDYSQAVPFIKTFGNAAQAASTGNAALVQLVRNIETRVGPLAIEIQNKARASGQLPPKEDMAIAMAYSQLYANDAMLANKGANKSELRANSPYSIDYNAVAIANAKNPATVVGQVLVDSKMRSPNMDINNVMGPRMLVESVKAKVLAGEIDPTKAAMEIANFYKTASDQQYESSGLKYLGLPRFQDFVITPGAQGGKTVDLFNPAQIENYLTSEVAKEKRIQSMPNSSFGIWR